MNSGRNLYPGPLFENFFQNVGADAGAVAEPFDEFLALLVVKGQRELVEEGREPHHINVGVGLAPAAQLFFYIGLRLGLAHIVGQLVRRILPVIGQEVVHVYGVPDQKRQKADGVLVIGDGFDLDLARRLVEEPFVGGTTSPVVRSMTSHQRLGSSSVLTLSCWVWKPSIR